MLKIILIVVFVISIALIVRLGFERFSELQPLQGPVSLGGKSWKCECLGITETVGTYEKFCRGITYSCSGYNSGALPPAK